MTNRILLLIIFVLSSFTSSSFGSGTSMNNIPQESVEVKVISLPGCRATQATIDLITETAGELGLEIDLEQVNIRTREEAIKHRHLGSPTVQVNGQDIDPSARDKQDFGIS